MPESSDCTVSMRDAAIEYIKNDNVAEIYNKMAQERKMGSIWDFYPISGRLLEMPDKIR